MWGWNGDEGITDSFFVYKLLKFMSAMSIRGLLAILPRPHLPNFWALFCCALALPWLNDRASAQSYTFLPPDHWARSALHRLAISGTTDITSTVLSWPASRAELFEWLDS